MLFFESVFHLIEDKGGHSSGSKNYPSFCFTCWFIEWRNIILHISGVLEYHMVPNFLKYWICTWEWERNACTKRSACTARNEKRTQRANTVHERETHAQRPASIVQERERPASTLHERETHEQRDPQVLYMRDKRTHRETSKYCAWEINAHIERRASTLQER